MPSRQELVDATYDKIRFNARRAGLKRLVSAIDRVEDSLIDLKPPYRVAASRVRGYDELVFRGEDNLFDDSDTRHVIPAVNRFVYLATTPTTSRHVALTRSDLEYSNMVGFPLLTREGGDPDANRRIGEVLLLAGVPNVQLPPSPTEIPTMDFTFSGNLGVEVTLQRRPFTSFLFGRSVPQL